MYNVLVSYSNNRLVQNLIELCAGRVLDEKWLIAPSRRVGMQWLDAVARSGRPVLNFRVKTLRGLATELAEPLMIERGLELIRGVRAEVLIFSLIDRLLAGSGGYLSSLEASPGLAETLMHTINDLRLAGLSSSDLHPGSFEVPAKGKEIIALLSSYESELGSGRRADLADVLRLAALRLESEPSRPEDSALLVIPDFMSDELKGVELRFWEAFGEGSRVVIRSDRAGESSGEPGNVSLLGFVSDPASAPAAGPPDGGVSIFRAVGEVNEVREVLRRCVLRGIPFDEVEIIHTDARTYVPLIFELCCRLDPEDPASAPVTFYEGIPSMYSRPARALLGWLSWTSGDFPQSVLVDLVADGLLRLDGAEVQGLSYSRLSAILRAVPIGGGSDRYIPAIDRELSSLERQLADGCAIGVDEDERPAPEEREARADGLRARIAGLRAIRSITEELLSLADAAGRGRHAYLDCARKYLESHVRRVSELDQYCAVSLIERITEMASCIESADVAGFDEHAWLADLPGATSVEGKGPRPGCLYVTDIHAGGHSGRPHTFIVGLDDGRFPGTGRQDPLLLDSERGRISSELATGSGRLADQVGDFARLLAGLRGEVTLGFCCRSLIDDREMFASPVVLSAYRLLDKREGDQKDLARWAGDPASFAPSDPGSCIDATEWWLSRTCGEVEAEGLKGTIARTFPNLARGFAAGAARASADFTEYDGFVPEAGAACDPTSEGGPTLSASRLETMARCPLEYFFRYVLKIAPPDEYEIDPAVWLDPAQKGELLHSAFRRFMELLADRSLRPDFTRDAAMLAEVLDEEIALWESRLPAPGQVVRDRESQDLHLTARIFLLEEQEHCVSSRPAYFEVSVGLEPDGEGCPLDCPEPATLELPGDDIIRVHGRIDRIDELPSDAAARFAVWDYKTGSARGYEREDPFRQGRHVQNALYLELAAARLAELHPGATVASFGYFFPGSRSHGERIVWEVAELAGAKPILSSLCRMLAAGCFPFTDAPDDDLRFSDYTPAFGETASAAADIMRKLANPGNEVLRPFRELRQYEAWLEEAE